MKYTLEQLKSDESIWPEGAEVLLDGHIFTKWCCGEEWRIERGDANWSKSSLPWTLDRYKLEGRHEVLERPSNVWNGGCIPPVGVPFEFSYDGGDNWWERVVVFNDGITCLMAHSKYSVNRWHYKCNDPYILCRPLKTEQGKIQDDLQDLLSGGMPYGLTPKSLAVVVMDNYELVEK